MTICAILIIVAIETAVYRVSNFNFDLPENKSVVFIGHSMLETSINDELIPNAVNWAHSGDSPIETYWRLKRLLKDSKNLKCVVMSISPHDFSKNRDNILFSEKFMKNSILRYYPLIGIKKTYETWGIKGIKDILSNPMIIIFNSMRSQNSYKKELGAYKELVTNNLKDDIEGKWIKRWRKNEVPEQYGSSIIYGYLKKIKDECDAAGIKFVMLGPPVYHSEIYFNKPFFPYDAEKEFFKEYENIMGNTEFWNYYNCDIPDNCFADINHLNKYGSQIFSKIIEKKLEEEIKSQ